jgi:hypothetical protein
MAKCCAVVLCCVVCCAVLCGDYDLRAQLDTFLVQTQALFVTVNLKDNIAKVVMGLLPTQSVRFLRI